MLLGSIWESANSLCMDHSNFAFKLVKLSHSKFYLTKDNFKFYTKNVFVRVFLGVNFVNSCLKSEVSIFSKSNISCKTKNLWIWVLKILIWVFLSCNLENLLLKSVQQGHVPSPLNAPVTFQILVIIRPFLDAMLKQGVLRIFQHGLVRLGTPLF